MLCVAVFLGFLLCQSSAEQIGVRYRCKDSSIGHNVSYSTFTPSLDGVRGRYTAELCTFNNPNRTLLTMDLMFNENLSVCDEEFRNKYRRQVLKPGPQHSTNTDVDVSGLSNCSHICYAMDFDLIFSSCYLLKSTLNGVHRSHSPHDDYYLVSNNITKEEYNKTEPFVVVVNHDDHFTLQWILGIPAVDYSITLRQINNKTGDYLHQNFEVTQNCSTQLDDVRQLRCVLAPPYGCYQAALVHGGLWTSGVFYQKKLVNHNLCHLPVTPPMPPVPRNTALWWACGGALLGTCALLAALGLRDRLRLRDYHKSILDHWFNNNREPDIEVAVTRDSRDVLLLYAREGEHGQQAMAALRELIQHSTGGKVYDMFSPEVMALCGPAPHTWVRGLLQSEDVRVLLVQSPATAALYQDQLCEDEGGLRLREPLLGRRAMYRAPQYGDQLLKMALRQLAETPAAHQDYHKFYLATYQGLETDILPQVVSYRRYLLPDAARVLAVNLSCTEPDGNKLSQLSRAMHALLTHVQHHPDYLMDEIFIN